MSKYATNQQIQMYEQENNLTFLYRGIRGLHFKDCQDESHYIKSEREVIISC